MHIVFCPPPAFVLSCRFLNPLFPEHTKVVVDEEKGTFTIKPGKNENRRLELVQWLTGWDTYALVAAMLKQMTYLQAMQHKASILEVEDKIRPHNFVHCSRFSAQVAALAIQERRNPLCAVLYDELIR